ncbi:hypothetical protein [Yinghuangia soli]|uniref:Uncharacterized protein n=1 Tax=Yinghuangia soli TaxID=2908204 RepID=A0AA41Q147_9ACTN|nr:hypothetical protein [Yinghuangia soli]MCF2528534.1 hypothetical protein [Yinghuangia soli]
MLADPRADVPDWLVARAVAKRDHWSEHTGLMRRLLPDVVGLLARGGEVDAQAAMRALAAARWQEWPPSMAQPVAAFLDAWFLDALRRPAGEGRVGEVFTACSAAVGSASPWLRMWEAERTPAADAHLSDCCRSWAWSLLDGDPALFVFPPWDSAAVEAELADWIVSYATDRLAESDVADAETVRLLRLLPLPEEEREARRWVVDEG